MTTQTISEITKTVVSQNVVQNAQKKFAKDFNKKGGVQAQSLNVDLKNAILKEMDFTETENLKDLGVINHLEIPTENGKIIYSFNEAAHSIQVYANADEKKDSLFAQLNNNKEFQAITNYIKENNGEVDNSSLEAISYSRELSDSDEKLEHDSLTALVRDKDSQEVIGQILYNGTYDNLTLDLGDEQVVVTDDEIEVTASASCAVNWMKCMLNCLCGATVGSCAIAVSGCIGACCGCSGIIGCLPCAGCIGGVAACGTKCGGGSK